jgi:hypothetical protein
LSNCKAAIPIYQCRFDLKNYIKQNRDCNFILPISELSFMCNETFNSSLEENLNVIQNYPRGIADDYLWKVGVNMSEPYRMKEFPVFATAIDRKYYPQSQGLFHSLHKRFLENPKYSKNVKIIVYDLGMTSRQLRMVSNLDIKIVCARCRAYITCEWFFFCFAYKTHWIGFLCYLSCRLCIMWRLHLFFNFTQFQHKCDFALVVKSNDYGGWFTPFLLWNAKIHSTLSFL